MPIVPETKSWTWVLERPCPECGFDAASFAATDVAGMLRATAARWPAVLARPEVRVRPDDATWSPLEYGAHVRDVMRICRYRLTLMRTEDDPAFPNWDQDETAVAERYDLQDPATVAAEIAEAAAALAADLDEVASAGETVWSRPGRRSDGAAFTVESFAKYFIHDVVHHLWDVRG
ncbi:DinB family protein [Galbitalea soli]|uniref:DinB family protein n=1 Tax=Galbitalea soli TaxID=1268042 RepID=A0A7C9TSB0_9MICO|nr:DinB family protein [Galbitalea soli]NEM91804.1 DinB family protein [Galbitalea soli]NYJ29363.1 hypothetical protein [Galbitalea soli]